tara:strand:- start:872 stop:1111 length:240 start_codon:yes stop_codon:yes gene_type:complete
MQEIIQLIIGVFILILAFPLGSLLVKYTKEELKQGQKWFKLIIFISLIGTITSLVLKNDILFFSFLFIIIVTSKSLVRF